MGCCHLCKLSAEESVILMLFIHSCYRCFDALLLLAVRCFFQALPLQGIRFSVCASEDLPKCILSYKPREPRKLLELTGGCRAQSHLVSSVWFGGDQSLGSVWL